MKKLKIPYLFPILFGITVTILSLILVAKGGKNEVNSYLNIYPETLTTHMPELGVFSTPTYSYIPFSVTNIIGGGGTELYLEKDASLKKFVENNVLNDSKKTIEAEDIFSIQVDFRNQEYIQKDYSNSSKYPFPKLINKENFSNYKILFYDFGIGKYMDENKLSDNPELTDKWKHGYSRGIAENNENEYVFWILVW